jgi:hypothetical protein
MELSPEAKIAIDFCRRAPAILIHPITAGIAISLGKSVCYKPKWWDPTPHLVCSPRSFKELQQAGLLICIPERYATHAEQVYTVNGK